MHAADMESQWTFSPILSPSAQLHFTWLSLIDLFWTALSAAAIVSSLRGMSTFTTSKTILMAYFSAISNNPKAQEDSRWSPYPFGKDRGAVIYTQDSLIQQSMSQSQYHQFGGKRKASDSPFTSHIAKRPRPPGYKEYSDVRAIVITYQEHDLNYAELGEELERVVDLFENLLGVKKCVEVKIPAYLVGNAVGGYVRNEIEGFKAAVEYTDVLNLMYYAGHGGRGSNGRTLTAASGRGQSFEWNSLQWDCIFSGDCDTLVFMDCCFAGASFRCSFQGRKDVFGACSAMRTTAGPGPNSFTDLLILAAWSMSGHGFILENWVNQTDELAEENGCIPPVSQSFGDARHQIFFQPQVWMAKKRQKEAKEQAARLAVRRIEEMRRKQIACINATLVSIWEQPALAYESFPSDDEIGRMERDRSLELPLTEIGVYRAFRKIKDDEVEEGLSGMLDAESEDNSSEYTPSLWTWPKVEEY